MAVLTKEERKKLERQAVRYGNRQLADVLDMSQNPDDGTFDLRNLDIGEVAELRQIVAHHASRLQENDKDAKAMRWMTTHEKLVARMVEETRDVYRDVNGIPLILSCRHKAVIASHIRSIAISLKDRGREHEAMDEAEILELIGKDGERISSVLREGSSDDDSEIPEVPADDD